MTLLFVSPVEGQVGDDCVTTRFPGEPGSCPPLDDQGEPLFCLSYQFETGSCLACSPVGQLSECEVLFGAFPDQVANCQRSCFDFYACATNADCPDSLPYCTNGQCEACVVSAFPGEPGSCPALDDQGNPLLCVSGQCQTCESAGITSTSFITVCRSVFADEDQQENCLRNCLGYYDCTSDADCRADRPTCIAGQCMSECEVSAFPGETGSCSDIPVGELFAGPQSCSSFFTLSVCVSCARNEQDLGITTAADCEKLTEAGQTADFVANCQRECFGFFACTTNADCPADRPLCDAGQCLAECGTNADCPADRPICNAGQCEISVFSPLDGMGGGSSA